MNRAVCTAVAVLLKAGHLSEPVALDASAGFARGEGVPTMSRLRRVRVRSRHRLVTLTRGCGRPRG